MNTHLVELLNESVKKGEESITGVAWIHCVELEKCLKNSKDAAVHLKSKGIFDYVSIYQISKEKHPTNTLWSVYKAWNRERTIWYRITVKGNYQKTFEAGYKEQTISKTQNT